MDAGIMSMDDTAIASIAIYPNLSYRERNFHVDMYTKIKQVLIKR